MGVLIPVGGTQATMRWSVSGDPEFMHVTIGLIDLSVTEDPDDIADRFYGSLLTTAFTTAASINSLYSLGTSLVATHLSSGWVSIEVGVAVGGTAVLAPLPNNCAVLVRKRTDLGGRRNRGRMYFPPFMIGEGDVNQNGRIDAADVTAFQAVCTDLFDTLVSNNLQPVVWHENGGAGTQVTSFLVQPVIATQRTRMRR